MTGATYGQTLHHLIPGLAGPAGAYALVGIGAVFAGAARVPITAVVIMFELTGEYSIILPTAIVLATGVSHLLTGDSIYTLKLRRRGVDLDQPDGPAATALAAITAGQVMEPVGPTVTEDISLLDAAGQLSHTRHSQLAVLDTTGAYRGILTAHGAADLLADGHHDTVAVSAAVERPEPRRRRSGARRRP